MSQNRLYLWNEMGFGVLAEREAVINEHFEECL